MGYFDGLKSFVLDSNFIELSVAFVLGLSFRDLIYAFISDWVTPFFAAMGGDSDFNNLFFTLNNSRFNYGHFINVMISTMLLVVIVYTSVIYPYYNYKTSTKTIDKTCNACKSYIHLDAIVCKFCCQ